MPFSDYYRMSSRILEINILNVINDFIYFLKECLFNTLVLDISHFLKYLIHKE